MDRTVADVLEFVRDNDVQFVRLAFCDLLGNHKNISILPHALPAAFENGISFDAHAIAGFGGVQRSDLFLFPDPATVSVLPWRPGPGRVIRFYCNIRRADGSDFWGDTRLLLQNAVKRCADMGYACEIGAECEFYLFKTDEDGNPTRQTLDRGGYFDALPLDKGENIRREICLCLEEMGLRPESSHHEQGPGQNEVDFKFTGALTCADHIMTFKSVVKAIASRGGLFASFMPKPLPNESGNGLHVNLSLRKAGRNVFEPGGGEDAARFIAGVMRHIREITAFLNPNPNSYARLGEHSAPRYVSWSHQNRSQLIRIPAASAEQSRMELRSPDPSVNPYLALAVILHAGLDGIEKAIPPAPSVDADLYDPEQARAHALEALPDTLAAALRLAADSAFVRDLLPAELLSAYLRLGEREDADYQASADQDRFCEERYFPRI